MRCIQCSLVMFFIYFRFGYMRLEYIMIIISWLPVSFEGIPGVIGLN